MNEKSDGEQKLDALLSAVVEVCFPLNCRVNKGGNRTFFQHGDQSMGMPIELTPAQVGARVSRFLREEVHA